MSNKTRCHLTLEARVSSRGCAHKSCLTYWRRRTLHWIMGHGKTYGNYDSPGWLPCIVNARKVPWGQLSGKAAINMSRIESFSVHCLCDMVSSTSEDGRPRMMCCSGVTRKLAFCRRIRLSVCRERRQLETHEFVLRHNLESSSRKERVVLEHVTRHPAHVVLNYLRTTSWIRDNYQRLVILQMSILFQRPDCESRGIGIPIVVRPSSKRQSR